MTLQQITEGIRDRESARFNYKGNVQINESNERPCFSSSIRLETNPSVRLGYNPDYVEEARQFLKDSALNNWLMTLTRIRYNPGGNDTVIHNYKQKDEYEIPVNFVGPDGAILSVSNAQKPVQALLDTKQTLQEINDVYKWLTDVEWLTDVDSYLWRLNSKPEQINERVACFVASSSRAYLGCDWVPQFSGSWLGVKIYPQGRA